jgi:ribose transport system substrate-binding protein
MKNKVLLRLSLFIVVFALVASGCQTAQPTTAPAAQPGTGAAAPVVKPSSGLIGTPERADQEYVWISNWSSLPMFVERVYPSLDAFARDFGVKVRKAGPTSDDLAAYITTVETECSRKPAPAGVIVVGGWDQSLQEPVNKCLAMKVPVVVTDGDLPNSKRLSYVGTNWYNLGVLMAKNQLKYHEERGLKKGKVAILTPLSYQNIM